MSVFDYYEPHTEYIQAVRLAPANFDQVAEELSRGIDGGFSGCGLRVAKNLLEGEPESLTITLASQRGKPDSTLTCRMSQYIVRRGEQWTVEDRIGREWRRIMNPWR